MNGIALLARAAELEAKAGDNGLAQGSASVVAQLWRYALAYVPRPIIVAGVLVFAAFHGWQWYVEAQGLAVETRLKTAKAAIENAKAAAANAQAGDVSVRVASFRAEVKKKQQEAARLRIELEAQDSLVNNESLKVQTVRAEVAKKQAEAAKARIAADAATQREGLPTLEEKAAVSKLKVTELEAIVKNAGNVSIQVLTARQPGARAQFLRAICSNAYAELIGCPADYVRKFRPTEQPARAAIRAAPSSATVGVALAARYAIVQSLELNVRSCPELSARCREIYKFSQGARIKITRPPDINGWVEVEIRPGERGFVNGKFLAVE